MIQAINLTMAMLLVAIGSALAIALVDPKFMRWICARGLSLAACVEAFKRNRPLENEYWDKHLGIDKQTQRQLLIGREDEAA